MILEKHVDDIKPVCPYCGYVDEDVFELHECYKNWIPGEIIEVKCPECEHLYNISWEISYTTAPESKD